MLLRTALLLLLCTTSGLCATLGLYSTQAPEEEEGDAAVTVDENTLIEGVAVVDSQVGDSAAKEPNLFTKILGVVDQAADDAAEVDVPVADSDAGTDRTDEDVPAEEALARDQPSEEDDNEIRPVQTEQAQNQPVTQEDDSSWSLNSIRNSFQSVHGYFDSLVELVGGRNGVCEYRCRYGELPQPRPGYVLPEPNGCSSSLVGFQVNAALDLGIPAMTQCCNHLDVCYDTCGTNKYDCDDKFRSCLHDICSDLKKSLGFGTKVQACESMADALYNTVWTLGCRPYMNSQRAACFCHDEEKDEL